MHLYSLTIFLISTCSYHSFLSFFQGVPGCFKEGSEMDMFGKNVCYDANEEKPRLRHCRFLPHVKGTYLTDFMLCYSNNSNIGNRSLSLFLISKIPFLPSRSMSRMHELPY